jgi:hypothetical protein
MISASAAVSGVGSNAQLRFEPRDEDIVLGQYAGTVAEFVFCGEHGAKCVLVPRVDREHALSQCENRAIVGFRAGRFQRLKRSGQEPFVEPFALGDQPLVIVPRQEVAAVHGERAAPATAAFAAVRQTAGFCRRR